MRRCYISAYCSLKLDLNKNLCSYQQTVVSFGGGGYSHDPLIEGFAPGPMGHSPQTPVVALHFGSRFVCGYSLQISCAPLIYNIHKFQMPKDLVLNIVTKYSLLLH